MMPLVAFKVKIVTTLCFNLDPTRVPATLKDYPPPYVWHPKLQGGIEKRHIAYVAVFEQDIKGNAVAAPRKTVRILTLSLTSALCPWWSSRVRIYTYLSVNASRSSMAQDR
jgi:hypothetical protein